MICNQSGYEITKVNNMNTTNVEVSTKANKLADAVVTNLTINWDNMTPEDIRDLAQQALVVKLQSQWRNNTIPEGDHTVNAAEHKIGTRAARKPTDVMALIQKMSPAEREALLAKLAG